MATRAYVGIELENGNVEYNYCHHDGYMEHLGEMLINHYNTKEKVQELIAMGDASSIYETISSSEFYHRDRKEPFVHPAVADSVESYLNDELTGDIEWVYVFRTDGTWVAANEDKVMHGLCLEEAGIEEV